MALDFGPAGGADVTANLAEAVPAGPVLHDPAEPPALGPGELPLLRVRSCMRLPLDHQLVQQARRQPVLQAVALLLARSWRLFRCRLRLMTVMPPSA